MDHTNDNVWYSYDEWLALRAEVERQGGAVQLEPCVGEPLRHKVKSTGKVLETTTCQCGNSSMAVINYEPTDASKARGAGFARVCLVCDVAGLWPRFAGEVTA